MRLPLRLKKAVVEAAERKAEGGRLPPRPPPQGRLGPCCRKTRTRKGNLTKIPRTNAAFSAVRRPPLRRLRLSPHDEKIRYPAKANGTVEGYADWNIRRSGKNGDTVKSLFKVQNLVTKMEFHIKKSRFKEKRCCRRPFIKFTVLHCICGHMIIK